MHDPSPPPRSGQHRAVPTILGLCILAALLLFWIGVPWAIWAAIPLLVIALVAVGRLVSAAMGRPESGPIPLPKWSRSEWSILGLLWAVPILLLGVYGQAASLSAGLATLGAFAALQIIAFRHGGWQFVGPHVYYDVVRLARRGRSTMLRVFCLFAMLGGLFIVYQDFGRYDRMRPNDFAMASVRFAYALFIVQNLAILLLAPAYIASTVTEERERGTLELLFSTQMSNREIVLGILSARIVHLFGFVIAGFPILALVQFWGGIDYLLIVGNLFNTLLNALTIGSLCVLISTLARGSTSAVMTAYAVVLPIGFCCSGSLNGFPLVLQDDRMTGTVRAITVQDVGVLAVLHVLISAFCLWLAIMAIREHEAFAPALAPPPRSDAKPEVKPTPKPIDLELSNAERRGLALLERLDIFGMPYALPPVTGDALWWKERHLGGPSLVFSPMFLGPAIPFLASIFCLVFAAIWNAIFEGATGQSISHGRITNLIRFFYWLFLGFFLLSGTYRAVASIARERQHQTLEPLLLLPIDRRDILLAKFAGCLYRGWPWLLLIGLDLAIGLLVGVFHPFSFICLVVGPLPMMAFFLIGGMYLSVVMRTVMRAYLTFVIALVVYVGLSLMGRIELLAFAYLDAFMWPIWGLQAVAPVNILSALGAMAAYGILAALFWWRLTVRFEDRSLL